jgi:hypothetical protein
MPTNFTHRHFGKEKKYSAVQLQSIQQYCCTWGAYRSCNRVPEHNVMYEATPIGYYYRYYY